MNIHHLAVVSVLLMTGVVNAETDVINPTDDSYVAGPSPDENYGDSNTLTTGLMVGGQLLTLIKFDLSPYSGVTVNSAVLKLYVYNTQPPLAGFSIARNEHNWDESNVTYNNMPGIDDYYSIVEPDPGEWWVIDVTDWVQDVASGAHYNYGWRLTGNGYDYHKVFAYSKEYTNSSFWPYLEVDYTPSILESTTFGKIKAIY